MERSKMTNPMQYDLADLRVFVAIAEARNLTHGAQKVNLAPSSASHRLSSLEDAIGSSLFTRQARGVSLTKAGEALLRHSRKVFAQLEQMHADLTPFAKGLRGHIRIWANTHATHTYLPADLSTFLKNYSQVSVSLEEHTSLDIVMAVMRGEVDVGVVAEEVEGADVVLIPYRSDRLVLIVPLAHDLADLTCVQFSQVLEYPFVLLNAGSAIHTFTMNAASAQGKHLDVRIQVRSFEAVCRMVAAGVGVGLVPYSAVIDSALKNQLVVLDLHEAWAKRDLKICLKNVENQGNEFVNKLIKHLTA
jgi:DNA-binding transcriptional LysR family regulator